MQLWEFLRVLSLCLMLCLVCLMLELKEHRADNPEGKINAK